MQEFYRTEENQRYEETYRSQEYNRETENFVSVESFRTSEYNSDVESSSPRKTDRKSDSVKKSLLSNGLILPAVGAVAGAAVLVAVVVTVLVQISLLSFAATACFLNIRLSVENTGGSNLVAYLTAEDESYVSQLGTTSSEYTLDFGLLTPDTKYLLEVKDGSKTHYSQTFRTAPYVQKLHPVEISELPISVAVQFDDTELTANEYDVYLNRVKQSTAISANSALVVFEELFPCTDYEIMVVDPATMDLLYWGILTTGSLLEYDREYINANAMSVKILKANLNSPGTTRAAPDDEAEDPSTDFLNRLLAIASGELEVTMNGTAVATEETADGDIVFEAKGLQPLTDYAIEVRSREYGLTLMRETLTTSDITVEADIDVSYTSASLAIDLAGSVATDKTIYLYEREILLDTVEFAADEPVVTEFEALSPGTVYTLSVYVDYTPVLKCTFTTTSYFDLSAIECGQEISEDGFLVTVVRRTDDSSSPVLSFSYPEENMQTAQIFCYSENDTLLPVLIGDDGTFTLGTQYAQGDTLYCLTLQPSDNAVIYEYRFIRVEGDMTYPEFEMSVNLVTHADNTVSAVLTVEHTGGQLFDDKEGLYAVDIRLASSGIDTAITSIYLDDLTTSPLQEIDTGLLLDPEEYNMTLRYTPSDEMAPGAYIIKYVSFTL